MAGESTSRPHGGDWLKLYRSIVDTAFWHDDWLVRLWIWCLVKANYADASWRGMKISRGEFITGRNTAADELGVSPSKWMRGIMRLVDLGCIKYEANSNWTRLTVCNYLTYQDGACAERTASGQVMTQRTDNERTSGDTTSGQPADTREEGKNSRREESNSTHAHSRGDWSHLSDTIQRAIKFWNQYWSETHGSGKPDSPARIESMLSTAKSAGWSDERIAESVTVSIGWNAKSWRDPEADHDKVTKARINGRQKPPKMSIEEIIG